MVKLSRTILGFLTFSGLGGDLTTGFTAAFFTAVAAGFGVALATGFATDFFAGDFFAAGFVATFACALMAVETTGFSVVFALLFTSLVGMHTPF
jgi:hypothetical protein